VSIIEKALRRAQAFKAEKAPASQIPVAEEAVFAAAGHARLAPEPLDLSSSNLVSMPAEFLVQMEGGAGDSQRAVTRQMRALKRALVSRLEASKNGVRNVVMVTSAVPGEGKTFVAFNLALSLAQERDLAVTLVDGDVVRRTASQMVNAERLPGLREWLESDGMPLSSVLCRTNVPNLSFLPAGQPLPGAAELMASARMDAALQRLAAFELNHVFIVDSPPVLATAEAISLIGKLHHALLVCRAGVTPQSAFATALEKLEKVPDVSIVLNGYSPPSFHEYHDYADYYAQSPDKDK
jgi:receptor protein-tyrosine kinase